MKVEINKEYSLNDIHDNPNDYMQLLFKQGYLIYRIHNILNNKNYIGDTNTNLYNRLFTGWYGGHFGKYHGDWSEHLYNAMRKYGLNAFYISIIYEGEYEYNKESEFIKEYDSYYNGYNNNLSGKGVGNTNEGKVFITKDGNSKMIYLDELDKYLNSGWELGRSTQWLVDTIWIHKDSELIRITKDELDYYQSLGYKLGTGIRTIGNSGYCWINDGKSDRQVPYSELENMLSQGYSLGRVKGTTNGTISINNGTNTMYINPDELNKYLELGWKVGSGFWVVNEEGDRHKIFEDQVLTYHKLGYKCGFKWSSAKPFEYYEEFKHLFI